ncbi:hypothetical protein AAE478_008361 [Parahypoxylon ruwenzoriense]
MDIDSLGNEGIMPKFRRAQFNVVGDISGDEVRSLPELIRFNAAHNGAHTFSYHLDHKDASLVRSSFEDLSNAVDYCAAELLGLLPEIQLAEVKEEKLVTSKPVAIFLESGLNLFVHIAALLSIGVPVVVLSARLSVTAINHLLRETGAHTVITSQRLWSQVSIGSTENTQQVKIHFARPCNFHSHGSNQLHLAPVREDNCDAFILHSSGTTGLPKPIYHPQRYLLGYAACYEFGVDEEVSGVNVSTLPMYHGFGLLAPMLALSIGIPCCLPSPTSVPTAESTIELLRASSAKSLMTVPSILEDIMQDAELNAPILADLDFVAAGGGPMKPDVAEQLANHGVNLLNHFGATELGALAPIFRPKSDYDWRYLRLRRDMGLQLLPVDEGNSDGIFKLVGLPVGRSSPFTLQDKIKIREGSDRDIRLLGRNDDIIVLANGEKVMPQTLESALSTVSGVKTALAFGNGRFEVGILVEPTTPVPEDEEALRKQIWARILQINPSLDAHARVVDPDIIIILQDGQHIPRSDKGSVMRSETYRVFDDEIASIYAHLETNQYSQSPASQDTFDIADLQGSLGRVIETLLHLPSDWDHRDDLFELGLDSLKATRLQRIVSARLRSIIPDRKTLDRLVYRYPTVQGMAERIQELINGVGNDSRDSDIDLLEKLAATFSAPLCPDSKPGRAVVLLTGSTGSIGCHLLACLAQLPEVEKVVCLNRPTKKFDETKPGNALIRQRHAFSTHGLDMPESAWSKVTTITAETRKANTGLDYTTYRNLSREITHIVHNAWPMDFKRPVSSFSAHFESLRNLLQLALDASTISGNRTRFIFHSSIAVTANFVRVTGRNDPVPETPITDPSIPSTMGYAQAKWVCERIVEKVSQKHPDKLDSSIIRIGQVVGSTSHGAWNTKEHFPALLKTAHSLQKLPDLRGTLSWLPVDVTAASIADIVLYSGSDQLVYHIENPQRQGWHDVLGDFRDILSIKERDEKAVPFDEWTKIVRDNCNDKAVQTKYPAAELLDFLETDFLQLGVGEVVLDLQNSRRVSGTLDQSLPIGPDLVRLFVENWRSLGFMDA